MSDNILNQNLQDLLSPQNKHQSQNFNSFAQVPMYNQYPQHYNSASCDINTIPQYQLQNNEEGTNQKTELIKDFQNKITKFKESRLLNKAENLLNFDVSREGLKNFYNTTKNRTILNTGLGQSNQVSLTKKPKNEDLISNNLNFQSLPRSNSKPNNILYDYDSQNNTISNNNSLNNSNSKYKQRNNRNKTKDYFGVNLQNLFKGGDKKNIEKNIEINQYKHPTIIQTNTQRGKYQKNYIQFDELQLNNRFKAKDKSKNKYNLKVDNLKNEGDFDNSENDGENNKIKTQINLYVKQLNYNNNNESSNKKFDKIINKKMDLYKNNYNSTNENKIKNKTLRNFNTFTGKNNFFTVNKKEISSSTNILKDKGKDIVKDDNNVDYFEDINNISYLRSLKNNLFMLNKDKFNSLPMDIQNDIKDIGKYINILLD